MTQRNGQVILLTVTEFARACDTTARTIRFYEKNGLIKPFEIDLINKYRYYRPEQAKEIFKIKLLQNFHFSLKEIKFIRQTSRFDQTMTDKVTQLGEEFLEKQKELLFLKEISSILADDKSFAEKVQTEPIGPFHLFCFNIENGDYNNIEEYIDQARKTAAALNFTCSSSEITFYHERLYTPKSSRLEIALILKNKLAKKIPLPTNYIIKEFKKTKAFTFDFHGPYTYLSLIHDKMDEFVKKEGTKVKGPTFEYYLKNPIDQASPYEYLTKICFPI